MITLKQFTVNMVTDFRRRYKKKITAGTYHLKSFRVLRDPLKRRLIAFLNCEEGLFWSASPMIVNELDSEIGKIIDMKLRDDNGKPNNEMMEIEIAYIQKSGGKASGLGFVLE
jgi:hypothetical protein